MHMYIPRVTAIILVGVLLLMTPCFADKVSTDISIAGVGARPLGMGKAFTAVADDSNALFLNPAGLGFQTKWELTSLSTRLLNNIDYKMVGGVLPTSFGVVGVGYLTTSLPAGYTTITENVGGIDQIIPVAPINYRKDVVYLSLGNKLEGVNVGELSVGGSLKLEAQSFSDAAAAQATGYDADLSLLWKVNKTLSVGLNAQNLLSTAGKSVSWSTGENEKNRSAVKLGGAYRPNEKLVLALDGEYGLADGTPLLLHGGVEFKPVRFLSLRMGIDQNPLANGSGYSVVNDLTCGVGVEISGVKFDYAYHQDSEMSANSTHYFSISLVGKEKPAPVKLSNSSKETLSAVNARAKNLVMDAPAKVKLVAQPELEISVQTDKNETKPSSGSDKGILDFYSK